MPSTVTLAESVLFDGSGSGVELDTLALLVSVVSRAITVAVIVIVTVELAVTVPSEHETVASQLPWVRLDRDVAVRRRIDRIADGYVLGRRRTRVLNVERVRDRVAARHRARCRPPS